MEKPPTPLERAYKNNNIEIISFSTDTTAHKDKAGQDEDIRLLRAMYDQLYEKTFPASERVEFARYKELLLDKEHQLPVGFSLMVQNRGQENERILALALGTFFRDSKVGLHTFFARENNVKVDGLKITSEAVRMAQNEWFARIAEPDGGLRGLVSEADLPSKPVSTVMDPNKRLKIMGRFGGRVIPIDYQQPELEPGLGSVPLVLLSYPIPGTTERATAKDLSAWLGEFHKLVRSNEELPMEKDTSYTVPKQQLDMLVAGKWPKNLSEDMMEVLENHRIQTGFGKWTVETSRPDIGTEKQSAGHTQLLF